MKVFYGALTEGREVTAAAVCSNNDGEIFLAV